MRISRWKLVAAFLLMETFGGGRIVLAGPDKQLVVLSAALNRSAETLTLKGQNFGSTAPAVYCESMPMTVISATDTQLVVLFPAAMPDGTYLVTVAKGNGQPDRGVFYVHAPTRRDCAGQRRRRSPGAYRVRPVRPDPRGPRAQRALQVRRATPASSVRRVRSDRQGRPV